MTDTGQLIMTPTFARFVRRSLTWIGIISAVLLIALVVAVLRSATVVASEPMSATSAGPTGARALVEVLRNQGVDVVVTDSLNATADAAREYDDATLFVYDIDYALDKQQLTRMLTLTDTVVALDPSQELLELFSPALAPAGHVDGTATARCGVGAASAAEVLSVDGQGYRVLDNRDDAEIETCFGSGDDIYSLIQIETDGKRFVALGALEAFTNGKILAQGNAALGLNLLGSTNTLIWYLPGLDDYDTTQLQPYELSPSWLIPVSLSAFLVAIAAMLWRGRRLGPLVVENLPVTVRASETMRGRARLYEHANARLHTLDSLRIGTIARLATTCGLPVVATVDDVIFATAAAAKLDQNDVRTLLVDAAPTNDRALLQLSDELLRLEQRVAENLRPN